MKKTKEKPNTFAKTLTALMKEKSISVRDAAKLAGVGTSTIDSWRSGAQPQDYQAVCRLAQGLQVSLYFLLTGQEEAVSGRKVPAIAEVFEEGDTLFDGYAKILIQRLLPRKDEGGSK